MGPGLGLAMLFVVLAQGDPDKPEVVPCGSKYCNWDESCCSYRDGTSFCCPYAVGVCCPDETHCCPASLPFCNIAQKQCEPGGAAGNQTSVPMRKPVPARSLV
mmetsp:Transcript_42254/g.92167  ORF Transcript_42254/g.92167 Transcript_42254/m.92167 type:complete len:103 (+) Transcript_42254:101-409(+)